MNLSVMSASANISKYEQKSIDKIGVHKYKYKCLLK